MKTLDQTIYTDGSGIEGLYEVYGIRIAGHVTHDRVIKVFPILASRDSYVGKKVLGMRRSAMKKVEAHLTSLLPQLPMRE